MIGLPVLPAAIRPWMIWLGLVLILCLLLWVRSSQLDTARASLAAAEQQLTNQSNVLQQLHAESDRVLARADQAQHRALALRVQAEKRMQAALTAPVPADCIGAMRWGADAGAALALRWESAP